jgi:hypothetical protein
MQLRHTIRRDHGARWRSSFVGRGDRNNGRRPSSVTGALAAGDFGLGSGFFYITGVCRDRYWTDLTVVAGFRRPIAAAATLQFVLMEGCVFDCTQDLRSFCERKRRGRSNRVPVKMSESFTGGQAEDSP